VFKRNVSLLLGMFVTILLTGAPAHALPPSDWGSKDRIWDYVGQAQGASEQECLQRIAVQAVQAATGRFYFGEEMLRARDLLPLYLEKHAERFVVSSDVVERRQVGKRFQVKACAHVLIDQLFSDLQEKRFVYIPKSNPWFYVYLNETIDGAPSQTPLGRQAAGKAIDERGLTRHVEDIPTPPPGTDVAANPEQFDAARAECQKREIEVILSGSIATRQVSAKLLYYKDQTFYESRLRLSLIRVDDGKVLATTEKMARVARARGQDAIPEAVNIVVQEACAELLDYFTVNWAKTIHETAGYRLMLTGVSPEESDAFASQLRELDPSVKVYPRNYFGRVSVLNFEYEGDSKNLMAFLRRATLNRYRMIQHDDRRIELEGLRR